MLPSASRVRAELHWLGYQVFEFTWNGSIVVAFDYTIELGSHEGEQVLIGVSFQEEAGYPEYPPHWFHISPPIDDQKGGCKGEYVDQNSRKWLAMSRPPGDLWDQLPTKHMSAYITEHLRRLWRDV